MKKLESTDLSTAASFVRAGAPFSSIKQLFSSREKALRFFGEVRAASHPVANVGEFCECCQQARGVGPIEFVWQTTQLHINWIHATALLVGHINVPIESKGIQVSTFHAICTSCEKKANPRTGVRAQIAAAFSSLAAIVALIVAMIAIGMIIWTPRQSWMAIIGEWAVAGFGLITGVGLFARQGRQSTLRVPHALHGVIGKPFKLQALVAMQRIEAVKNTPPIFVQRYRANYDLTWQMTAIVLLLLFGVLPASILAFGADIDPTWRAKGRIGFAVSTVLTAAVLTIEIYRRRRVKAAWYAAAIADSIRAESSSPAPDHIA